MEKKYYQQSLEEVIQNTQASISGLTKEEVQKRQELSGFNELAGKKKKSSLALFIDTFKDAMVIVLLVVTLVQVIMGAHIEAIVIFSVLMLNSIVSVIQAKKAEGSLDALKNLSAPEAKVLRDGQEVTIPAKDIVVGDIVLLDAGDYVPADGRLIEAASLKVDEGMLTGESVPAEKEVTVINQTAPIGDRINSVYSGTIVTYGRGQFVVTGIANQTEIGQVADMLESTDEHKTPLQRGLDKFSHKLSFAILGLSLVILAVQVARIFLGSGSGNLVQDIVNAFMFAVAVAVAAIPEALQSIVTIVLSIGTKKMAKKNAIIRQLPAVETLGSASVICTDKTGTLTQNKMTVVDYYLANGEQNGLEGSFETSSVDEAKLMQISLLVNDAKVTADGKKLGDPTEIALIDYGLKQQADIGKLLTTFPRLAELPFDSERKLMSTSHEINGERQLLTKGAPDVLLNRSTQALVNGEVVPMTKERLTAIKKQNEAFAERALRVLAFGYKVLENQNELDLEDESDFVFVGLLAMIDPPREEVYGAIQEAKEAGIKTVMITGDHKTTAVAIAKDIGIFAKGDMALTGTELDLLNDKELANYLEKISVYARVSPENKIRIVRAWQEKGHVSAMTGDGVNDAPALKQADIGIAMGTGTDVAKDAAAMVLTDDNFASIISAVSVGRNVFDNIKKAIAYLFAGNLGAILAIIFALIVGWDSPFTALQLLFINLVNDSLPAIALGMEKAEPTIMKRAPRNPNEGIFSGDTFVSVAYRGALIGVMVVIAQYIGMQTSAQLGVAMAFSTLIWARTLQTFAARSNTETTIQAGFFKNKVVVWAVVICSLLYFVTLLPVMRPIFAIPGNFGFMQVGISLGLALAAVLLMETTKYVLNKKEHNVSVNSAVMEK
ncbi:cation-translocating P-type ATPase [Vagococcus zengguangii]|uniref:P-type Ca(2+) transporter n=1 Tax=Vagococcus zengguangii TaxID=2571750 RepID=A0A4D7CS31_9ENTE|nr:cation-translocating P-type ATPase [Vagococcus zengguangii]QCI85833.1 cation-translocating P-type ATPase [Vagococcus zengguangii]TLG81774.1 cation-translocating P-type ATPase [Vagococcus zengguangii]